MVYRFYSSILTLALALMIVGSAVSAGDIEDNLTYQGDKARIAVGTIKTKAGQCSYEMAAAIGEMLSSALVNSGRFIVLASHEEVAELAEEIEFAQSEYAEGGQGPQKGLMESADVLVTGAVTAFEPDAGGGGGMLGGMKKKVLGSAAVNTKTAEINMEIKLIDIRTRRILKSKTIKAKSTQWSADMTGGGWADDLSLEGALGVYSNSPMEDAIRTVLAKSVERISKEVPGEYYRYSGQGEYTTSYREGQSSGGEAAAAEATVTPAADAQQPSPPTGESVAEDMTLFTRYDFVPGDKVIFYDDLSDEEEGEFPFRWNLIEGVFEIARMGGEYWILCTNKGYIVPKIPEGPFPEKYTVEMEFYTAGPEFTAPYYYLYWINGKGKRIGDFEFSGGSHTALRILGKGLANKKLDAPLPKGTHTMRVMATTRSIKCYVDEVRVANVPKVEGFDPASFRVGMYPYKDEGNWDMIKSFRFAEGGKSMRDQLAETGRVVTHGILFDPDSYVIKGESYKTLKEIGELLQEDPALRVSVEGHTDSDGSDEHNQELSRNRAQSVCNYLVQTFGIETDRLEARGWGEAKPLDTNGTPEGKANNRRVELVKL